MAKPSRGWVKIISGILLPLAAAALVIGLAVGLTRHHKAHAQSPQGVASLSIQQKEHLEQLWSYGRSPAVYPSPNGTAIDASWEQPYAQAQALVASMALEEKVNITFGWSTKENGCVGVSGSVPRLNFSGFCLQDGPAGVRTTDLVSGFPAQIHLGATWNLSLVHELTTYMGAEFKAKGVNVALAPVVGPIGRVAKGGRNWEAYTNDPFLAGSYVVKAIEGIQTSVIASVKHFIGNEQETNRNPSPAGIPASVSSNIDDRTMHELYLWPFQDAVRAGAGCVMCSYNQINGSYGCQNSAALNGILKTELAFPGFVCSDWGAQHTGIASALGGLDMSMPDSIFWKQNLSMAVRNQSVPECRVDDMATRILATWYKFNQNDPSFPAIGSGIPFSLTSPHVRVDARSRNSSSTIFQAAVEGHVLVKNVNGALPLKKPLLLSLFGYDGTTAPQSNPSASSFSRWALGYESVNLTDSDLLGLYTDSTAVFPNTAARGTILTGGGSGANNPPYIVAPYDAFLQQAVVDGTYLLWDFDSMDPDVEPMSDACLVFINQFAAEGFDRANLTDADSDRLVANVAGKCNNTMVVIHNAGIRIVDAWIDHPNVTAAIFAHLPGQDSARALVEIMYGKQSPSGRLPYTVGKRESDYGSLLEPTRPGPNGSIEQFYPQSNFTEGLYIDYKQFLAQNIAPRYEFGYGLTYTTFSYSNLNTAVSSSTSTSLLPPSNGTIAAGGNPALFEVVASISCTVANVGNVTAPEVAQLYLGIPQAPERQLRGFSKVMLQPNATTDITFNLTRRDLSIWSVTDQNWLLQKGSYNVYVGASVLDIRLNGTLNI